MKNEITFKKLLYPILITLYFLSMVCYIAYLDTEKTNLKNDNKILADSLMIARDSANTLIMTSDSLIEELKRTKDFYNFLYDIADRESGINQYSTNKYGMMGLFQFSPKTLRFLGLEVNRRTYLSDVDLQVNSMISYMKFNKVRLSRYIKKYDGKKYRGVHITESGLLAGAHLVGAGGVIEFFDRQGKYNMCDANNVHVSTYIRDFSGHNMALLN